MQEKPPEPSEVLTNITALPLIKTLMFMQNLSVSSRDQASGNAQPLLRPPLRFHDSQQRAQVGDVVQQFCEICMKALTEKEDVSVGLLQTWCRLG